MGGQFLPLISSFIFFTTSYMLPFSFFSFTDFGFCLQFVHPTSELSHTQLPTMASPISEFILRAPSPSTMFDDPAQHISIGSFYEIDHSKLPPKCPYQLRSIRVVLVNEKTRMRVSLRFPSIYSLRAYFSESNCTNPDVKRLPALDEKYNMGSEIAAEALYRRIPHYEITVKKNLWLFWAVSSISSQKFSASLSNTRSVSSVVLKKGSLWSELKDTGMVMRGQRRQVTYLGRHMEDKGKLILTTNVTAGKEEDGADQSEGIDDEEKEIDAKADYVRETRKNSRKRKQPQRFSREIQKKKNQIVVYKQRKNKDLKNSIDRWSVERYKLAEVNMLKIMKEQGAVFGRPILRQELRSQARKLIGDTGLLDHLLKHMAGKVAPGGEERFRRRHNAEGAMEYWLEKADLVDIRRQAGVQDPYWTPPPGWQPGDNPTQDPTCAREIKNLNREIKNLNMENKNLKERISKLERDMEELISKKKREEELAVITTLQSSLTSLVTTFKEGLGELKTTMEEANRTGSSETTALMGLPKTAPTGTEMERKETLQQKKKAVISGELGQKHNEGAGYKEPPKSRIPAPKEDKAAKIERLKSGFRICKPQGTFLWPDMAISTPQVAVQFEDLFSVPTPPSASSTSAKQTHFLPAPPSHGHLPNSPVKHLTEKRHVPTGISTAVIRPIPSPLEVQSNTQCENSSISITSSTGPTTTTKTSTINLNEFPSNHNDNGPQSQGQNSYPVTYQRRSHHTLITINTGLPCLGPTKKEMINQWEGSDQGKELMRYCQQQQQGFCSSSFTSSCVVNESGDVAGSCYFKTLFE